MRGWEEDRDPLEWVDLGQEKAPADGQGDLPLVECPIRLPQTGKDAVTVAIRRPIVNHEATDRDCPGHAVRPGPV